MEKWQFNWLTPIYAKSYANSPIICVEICRVLLFEGLKNGVITRLAYKYGELYKSSATNPYNEVLTERQIRKTQWLCGFRDFLNRINLPLYTKFTPIGAENGAETKKSHNFKFHTAPEKLRLFRSFFHFS